MCAVYRMMNLAISERMPRPGRPASYWGYLANAYVLATPGSTVSPGWC
jgi:hypothetical protein